MSIVGFSAMERGAIHAKYSVVKQPAGSRSATSRGPAGMMGTSAATTTLVAVMGPVACGCAAPGWAGATAPGSGGWHAYNDTTKHVMKLKHLTFIDEA